MKWRIAKLGIEMFDSLHAFGLAILLATAMKLQVELRNEGLFYALSCSSCSLPYVAADILDSVFPLPGEEEVLSSKAHSDEPQLSVTVFDGLLAVLFTSPGPRVLSVSNLLEKRHFNPDAVEEGLKKVTGAIERWKKEISSPKSMGENGWLAEVLLDYTENNPCSPLCVEGTPGKDMHILMTIDPSLGYSLRRSRSDGQMTKKSNIAIRGTRFATLLTFIGASRLLRAQRLSGSQVAFYVPLIRTMRIEADTTQPLLSYVDQSSNQVIVCNWLCLWSTATDSVSEWSGLTYQTMQTQASQQALSLEKGVLSCTFLAAIEQAVGKNVMRYWIALLRLNDRTDTDVRERLVERLKYRRVDAWLAHLQGVTRDILTQAKRNKNDLDEEQQRRSYSLEEVKVITMMMNNTTTSPIPLKAILEREEGTLCFGRALRQLGQWKAGILRGFIEDMESVHTLEQLFPVLYRVVQTCEIVLADWKYIRVPAERDFALLLEDADRYGVPTLVGVLMVLSALRYRHSDEWKKYELAFLVRQLLLVSSQVGATDTTEEDHPLLPIETFLDDPEGRSIVTDEEENTHD